jgi:nucleotide-binding universal stress UspA family protein
MSDPLAEGVRAEIDRENRRADARYLITLAGRAGAGGCVQPPRVFSVDGNVAEALSHHIDTESVDLVVMTTHGRGGLSRAWLGSVADRLIRTTHVPVLLWRPHAAAIAVPGAAALPSHILIPLDGSALAESIIEPALALGALSKARYTLVQVVQPPLNASAACSSHAMCDAMCVKRGSIAYLERCAMRLRARGLEVDVRVVMQDNAAAGISEEAINAGCDLIAMATHGRTGWSRLALGSVADKVLRSAPVPMLVLRPVGQAATEPDTGSVNVNAVPEPSSLDTCTVPLCASMMPFTIARPSPIP